MAVTPQVSGVVTIAVGTGSEGALETLGYSEESTEPEFQPYYQNVPGDQNGGSEGPPIDIVWMGATARIRVTLSSWDEAISDKVEAFTLGGTRGQPVTTDATGTLMFGGSKTVRVCLNSPANPLNFPRCVLRGFNRTKGTKYNRLIVDWEAHKDASGVLFNETVA